MPLQGRFRGHRQACPPLPSISTHRNVFTLTVAFTTNCISYPFALRSLFTAWAAPAATSHSRRRIALTTPFPSRPPAGITARPHHCAPTAVCLLSAPASASTGLSPGRSPVCRQPLAEGIAAGSPAALLGGGKPHISTTRADSRDAGRSYSALPPGLTTALPCDRPCPSGPAPAAAATAFEARAHYTRTDPPRCPIVDTDADSSQHTPGDAPPSCPRVVRVRPHACGQPMLGCRERVRGRAPGRRGSGAGGAAAGMRPAFVPGPDPGALPRSLCRGRRVGGAGGRCRRACLRAAAWRALQRARPHGNACLLHPRRCEAEGRSGADRGGGRAQHSAAAAGMQ